jgi:PAS domain S-box-containing protein
MPAGRKYIFILLGAVVWLGVCGWFGVEVYRGARNDTARQVTDLEATLADQAARGISDHIESLERDVEVLARNDDVIRVTPAGRRALEIYFDSSNGELQSVTRMGPDGRILYTWPNVGSIGTDISSQTHVARLLATHRSVLSDMFVSVQSYRSIALHVPVYRGGVFDGSIGILVPIGWIAQRFLEGIRVGSSGYAWVIGSNGVEIYCPNPLHVGWSVFDRPGESPEEEDLGHAMVGAASGARELPRDHASGAAVPMHVFFKPIRLADNLWSVAVAAPETEVLARMNGFLRPWLVVVLLAVVGVGVMFVLYLQVALTVQRRRIRQEAEADYRAIVEKLPVIQYVVDLTPPPRTTYISPQIRNILGFTAEEWIADPDMWRRQIHPDDRDWVQEEVRQRDARGEHIEIDYRVLTADGRVRWIHNRSVPTRGNSTEVTGVMIDVTERRQAEDALREREEQLMQAHKMEAVGRLAGGVAHDFNNILTVIKGYADVMLEEAGMTETLRTETKEILSASKRAKTLIDQLLVHSRKQAVAPRALDLNAQVVQMEAMLRRLIGEHVGLDVSLAARLGEVIADPTQVQQILMNLVVNARDAMPDGGSLSIRTANVVAGPGPDPERPGLSSGGWVLLSVRDTGMGMDAETLGRIFEPFFTTKAEGRGTGLGLSTVYGIVTQSGGRVFAHSTPGQGSVFEIFLPRAEGAAAAPAVEPARAAEAPAPQRVGHGRVLLVEDETAVRELARTILSRAGYTVIEAANGAEAIAVLGSLEEPVDLLLTDVIMPVMGGAELARRLRDIRPGLPVVYVTGYADDALNGHGVFEEGANLLRKPFSAPDLLALVAKAIGR